MPAKDRFKYQRVYPDGELYAAITGFYSYDRASSGLERTYNAQLAGTDDALFVRRLVDMATNRTPEGRASKPRSFPRFRRRPLTRSEIRKALWSRSTRRQAPCSPW